MKKPLIVTFCNRDYIPVLANFMAAPGAPRTSELKVYGLDRATVEFARCSGAQAEALAWNGVLRDLWTARVEVFENLIERGQDFVHTDADAVWLRNPITTWMNGDLDSYFSQGTIHPTDTHSKLGFVLCCGLFGIRASDATIEFFKRLKQDVKETGDDQTSVNKILMEGRTLWESCASPDYRLRIKNKRFSCWKNLIVGHSEDYGLSVGLIPHGIVQRIHDPTETLAKVNIKHPLSPKKALDKLNLFAALGLLYIRPDWQAVNPSGGLKAFLSSG